MIPHSYPRTKFQAWLYHRNACSGGRTWVANKTPQQAWDTFTNLGWMFWLLRKLRDDDPALIDERAFEILEHCVYANWNATARHDGKRDKLACDMMRAILPTLPRFVYGNFQGWDHRQTERYHALLPRSVEPVAPIE